MTDRVELFRQAVDRFTALIDGVDDGTWDAPTPCAEWSVRDLVNHLAAEQLWAPHLMAGETIAQVGDRYDGDVLGDDPGAVWRAAAARSVAAFAPPGALERTVHLSYGDESALEYHTQMLTDAVVHGWDLARATGQPYTMDPEAVELLLDAWAPREEMLRSSGLFGERVEVPEDADPAVRLLALLGRRA